MAFCFQKEGHWKVQGDPREVITSQNIKTKVSRGMGGTGDSPKSLPGEGYGYSLKQHINELVHRERTSNPKAYCNGTSIKSNTTRV